MRAEPQAPARDGTERGRRPAWRALAAAAALTLATTGCKSSGPAGAASARPGRPAPPPAAAGIDPDDFVPVVDNRWLPLEPGAVFRLRGRTDGGVERQTVVVTRRTKEILGVATTVVRDVVRVDGRLAELTHDWYAQDRDGNVWYFGERTAEYERGKVASTEGSWEAGVDGARPGIVMNARPRVTDSFRQEHYEGEAEDMYWVVATGESKVLPLGRFDDVVRTLEWTPLEPRIVVEKLYAPGVGMLAERALSGPTETVTLVDALRR